MIESENWTTDFGIGQLVWKPVWRFCLHIFQVENLWFNFHQCLIQLLVLQPSWLGLFFTHLELNAKSVSYGCYPLQSEPLLLPLLYDGW